MWLGHGSVPLDVQMYRYAVHSLCELLWFRGTGLIGTLPATIRSKTVFGRDRPTQVDPALDPRLIRVQIEIAAFFRDQFMVRAAFSDLAMFDHEDLRGLPNGAQTVCDHKGGPVLH